MTKSVMVMSGVAAAALWAAGAMAEDKGATAPTAPAAPAAVETPAGMRGGMMFDRMDANKDGKVTQEEYLIAMAEMAKTRFTAMDADKDGALTEAEMRAGRERRGPGMGRPEGERRGEGARGPRSGGDEGGKKANE
jgi:hypothetical protein